MKVHPVWRRPIGSRVVIGLVAAALALGVAACGGDDEESAGSSGGGGSYTIGIALPTQQEERWQRDYKFFTEEAKNLGVDIKIQVADNDPNKQQTQIENFITQGVDALVIGAVDPASVGRVAQEAIDEGINVIGYARTVNNAKIDALVAFNYLRVGELAGEYAYKLAPKGNYVEIQGDATTLPDVPLYHQGHLNGIKPGLDSGDIKVVVDQNAEQWKPEEGLAITEDALTKTNNDIAAVMAANDGTAGGAIQALEAQGLAGKVVVVGNDADVTALQRIVKGTQHATIFQDTREQAKVTLQAAIDLLDGKQLDTKDTFKNGDVEVPAILLEPELVTKDNLDEIIIDRGFRTREEVYGS